MGERLLNSALSGGRGLIVVAALLEAEAVAAAVGLGASAAPGEWRVAALDERLDLLTCGIGKSNAAGATARALAGGAYRAVVNAGVCGSLPSGGGSMLEPGRAVVGTSAVFADEGLQTPEGFRDVAEMGFGPLASLRGGGVEIACDVGLVRALEALGDERGPIATVSTCSGTDHLAREVAARTGARVEAMEGAAIALVCARLGVPFAEWRVVSNTTGDRAGQRWDIRAALARLGVSASRL